MKTIIYTLTFFGLALGVNAQYVSITSQSSTYSEDFSTLGSTGTNLSTFPSGWWVSEVTAITTANNFAYNAGEGTSATGGSYSFGTGTNTDRALGSVASVTNAANFGVRYINNSGSSFSSFFFNLYMEQWRSGGRTGLDSLYFYYAVNGNNDSSGFVRINNGTWTRYSAADLVSKVTQATAAGLDGNLTANREYYGFYISGLTVNIGDTLYLRWRDPNVVGSDDGLGIDDYSFSVSTPVPVQFTSFNAIKQTSSNLLKWGTASENNNGYFEVQRSVDGRSFENITRVKGNGTSNKVNNYSYSDISAPAAKTVYYRLKQVDMDGKFEYSKTVSVVTTQNLQGIQTTLPNPFANEFSIGINVATNGTVQVELSDMIGKVHHSSSELLTAGAHTIDINTTNIPVGIYFVRVSVNGETFTRKVVKK